MEQTPLKEYELTIENAKKQPRDTLLSTANILADMADYAAQLEADKKALVIALERNFLFNDVFIERFHRYTRHDYGCTYDDLSKGDICTCGLQGLINLYYEIKEALGVD